MKYKVGDKVRIRNDLEAGKRYGNGTFESGMRNFIGNVATIEDVDSFNEYGLEGSGYWWTDEMIECLVEPARKDWKIVIRTDGDTTIATLYNGNSKLKETVAKLNPADKYDANIGAKLAFGRLMSREVKPEPYNAKIVCVDNSAIDYFFTTRKIYEIEDGLMHTDKDSITIHVKGLDDFNGCKSKWLEIVE